MELTFKKIASEEEIQQVYDYNIDAFSDTPDFKWTLDDIRQEIAEGWELFAGFMDEEIIAALFFKVEKDALLTKNTAVKMNYQGSGYSHKIKDYFEKVAKKKKCKRIIHYCRIDNFRMYSLNESHGFEKTGRTYGNDVQVVEWSKKLN